MNELGFDVKKTKFRGEQENYQQQVILCHGRRLPVKDEWRIEELFGRIFFHLEAFETFDPHKSWRVTFTPQYTRPKNKTSTPKVMPQSFCVALLTSRIRLSNKIWFSIDTPKSILLFQTYSHTRERKWSNIIKISWELVPNLRSPKSWSYPCPVSRWTPCQDQPTIHPVIPGPQPFDSF